MKKQTLIMYYYGLAACVILISAICMMGFMHDRVDFKYCSDNGTRNYFTVTGQDTTYYLTEMERIDFGTKWVAQR